MIHWSQNKDYLVVYHGTHIRNLADIFKNGIKNKDPITGMVSVAIGDRGEQVSRAYAGMAGVKGAGGEHNFRQLGQKAVSVPHKDRAVVVAHLPMDWVNQHVDRTFSGNSEAVKERLRSPEAHDAYVKTSNKDKKSGEDTSGRETMELRFSSPIPPEYIQKDNNEKTKYVTGESKDQPMKTFKEFVESIDKLSDAERALHSAFIDAGKTTIPRNSASFAIKSAMGPDHGGVTSDVMQDNMLRNINRKLGKNLSYIEDNQYEEVTTSSIPANSTAGVAKFDPLLSLAKLVRRLRTGPSNKKIPLNDINNYEHPGSAARSARTAGDGSVQGT